MTDKIKSPGGGNRNGASNIVFLFRQNNQDNTLRPPRRQALSIEQRCDLLSEARTFLCSIEHDGKYDVRHYLWQLIQRDMREVLND